MSQKPKLTEEQIVESIAKFKEIYGYFPLRTETREVPNLPNEKWIAINLCLAQGLRGLQKGNSLAKLKQKYFNVRNIGTVPNLTEQQIINWIMSFYNMYNEYPNYKDKRTIPEMNGENWKNINKYLINGFRGLQKGNSLPQLLNKYFGIRNIGKLPNLTEKQILGWIILFYDKYGEYPTRDEPRTIPEMNGDKWINIDQYLNNKYRGLIRKTTLADLKLRYLGIRNRKNLPKLTEEKIIELIKEFYDKYNEYPKSNETREVPGLPGDKWRNIDTCLRNGKRSLNKGMSIAKLVEKIKSE